MSQNGVRKTTDASSTESSTTSIHMIQIGSPQIGFTQITPTQIGGIQISIPDNSTFQPSFLQGNTKQIGSSQIGSSQIGLSQIGSAQVDISQNSAFEVNRTVEGNILGLDQLNSWKIALSTSIPSQQLLSSYFPDHNLLSALTNTYQDNPLNLFDRTFNINLQITDLPTGQLAEAQVTQFDQYGRPNGGTLLIDHDANGVGWFIDTTPWENREFAQTLVESQFLVGWVQAHKRY